MLPTVKTVSTSETTLYLFVGGEALGLDADSKIVGSASGNQVLFVVWPNNGTFTLSNLSSLDRVINLFIIPSTGKGRVPLLPPNFKLGAGYYAIFSPEKLEVFTPDGRSTIDVGYLMQTYTGTWADPNGHIVPDNPNVANVYYKDQNGAEIGDDYVEWRWSTTNQDWFKAQGN